MVRQSYGKVTISFIKYSKVNEFFKGSEINTFTLSSTNPCPSPNFASPCHRENVPKHSTLVPIVVYLFLDQISFLKLISSHSR